MNPKNFFTELKRRNVYKVAIAYAVVAWLLMQVASQIFPFFEIPNWAVRLVVLLLVIGFPIALVLAWAFELTPEGIKRAEDVDLTRSTTRRTSHKLLWITAVVAIVAAALFVGGRFSLFRSKRAAATAVASDKSIAVLPFDNLSRDPDNAYFAEGVQDEILTRLAKVADLKVISRASTQRFKSAPDNLPVIAKQLGVANILEGSVQKSADQVRVNVQLINALSDAHLWAEIYDRKLTDIFAVESDIAKTIADTLQAKLTGSEKHAISVRPTDNPMAHELYLKGRFFWNKRTGNDLKKSVDYFNQAIGKDPNYALAYAGIADSYALLQQYSSEPAAEVFPKARAAADKALAIDNSLAEAHASLGLVLQAADLNLKEAKREYERAIELNPNYADAHYFLAFDVLTPLGDFDHAIVEMKRAVELDPFSFIIHVNFGGVYMMARRYPEAISQLRKAVELDPSVYRPHAALGRALELSGQLEEAIAEFEKPRQPYDEPYAVANLGYAYALKGERAKALQFLKQMKELQQHGTTWAYGFVLLYVGLGDKEAAINELEQMYRDKDSFICLIKVNPLFDPLRGDPRFEKLANQIVPPDSH